MKKIFKIFISTFIITMTFCSIFSVEASSKTGHKEFSDITFLYDESAKLLIKMSKNEKRQMLKNVKRKAFGWSNYTNLYNRQVIYEANTIFSRSNNTRQSIEFKYSTTETEKKQTTKTVTGTLATKLSGKTTKISWGMDQSIRAEIGIKNDISYQEEIDFKIKIDPKRKVSLVVKGYATLSNGAAKYYLCGICLNQNLWEYVDVINEFYELCEEIIEY